MALATIPTAKQNLRLVLTCLATLLFTQCEAAWDRQVVGGECCSDNCHHAGDGYCDDGGHHSVFSSCSLGSDCQDCPDRCLPPPPSPPPLPPPPSPPPPMPPHDCATSMDGTVDLASITALVQPYTTPKTTCGCENDSSETGAGNDGTESIIGNFCLHEALDGDTGLPLPTDDKSAVDRITGAPYLTESTSCARCSDYPTPESCYVYKNAPGDPNMYWESAASCIQRCFPSGVPLDCRHLTVGPAQETFPALAAQFAAQLGVTLGASVAPEEACSKFYGVKPGTDGMIQMCTNHEGTCKRDPNPFGCPPPPSPPPPLPPPPLPPPPSPPPPVPPHDCSDLTSRTNIAIGSTITPYGSTEATCDCRTKNRDFCLDAADIVFDPPSPPPGSAPVPPIDSLSTATVLGSSMSTEYTDPWVGYGSDKCVDGNTNSLCSSQDDGTQQWVSLRVADQSAHPPGILPLWASSDTHSDTQTIRLR